MKKILVILAAAFILFSLEMLYINVRLNREINRIQNQHQIISAEMDYMESRVMFSKVRLNKLQKKIRRPLYKKTNYIFALSD